MSKEYIHVGQQFEMNGKTFECVSVSAQEDADGNLVNYKYEMQLASEVKKLAIAERKSAEYEQKLVEERAAKKHRLVEAAAVTQEQADNMTDIQLDQSIEALNAQEKESEAAKKQHESAPNS